MIGSPETPDFDAPPDLIDFDVPEVTPYVNVNVNVNEASSLYEDLCRHIYLVISQIITTLPLVLPDPFILFYFILF